LLTYPGPSYAREKAILHGLAITVLRMIEKVSGLVLVIFLFRLLDKSQVMEYTYIQTIAAVCAIFSIPELENAVSQSVARGYPGTYRRAVHERSPRVDWERLC
jgi:O-antigen/teichoic acid export membrane protein